MRKHTLACHSLIGLDALATDVYGGKFICISRRIGHEPAICARLGCVRTLCQPLSATVRFSHLRLTGPLLTNQETIDRRVTDVHSAKFLWRLGALCLLQTTQEAHGVDNKNVQLECPMSQQDVESQQPRQLCLADRCQRRQ